MLRYEIRMQDELQQERRYNEGIVRQAALFQTYIRMSENNFNLKWKDCMEHKDQKITPPRLSSSAKSRMKEVYESRSDMGHDWRVYIEPSSDRSQLQIFAKGRWILEELLKTELGETYECYTSNRSSDRLPICFEDRETMTVTTHGATVSRSCPSCGEELDKSPDYCPTCGWESDNPINP